MGKHWRGTAGRDRLIWAADIFVDALPLRCSRAAVPARPRREAAATKPPTYPKGNAVMLVQEFADAWGVTAGHVIDLIEEGQILAIDVAGRGEFIRIPSDAIPLIARHCNIAIPTLLKLIENATPAGSAKRSMWRIVREGWERFVAQRANLPDGVEAKLSRPDQSSHKK